MGHYLLNVIGGPVYSIRNNFRINVRYGNILYMTDRPHTAQKYYRYVIHYTAISRVICAGVEDNLPHSNPPLKSSVLEAIFAKFE